MIPDENQPTLLDRIYRESMDTEWPVPRVLSKNDLASYPNRILIEQSCDRCGQGFSSIKPKPKFCSSGCYRATLGLRMKEMAGELWKSPEFLEKITSARRAAGYPTVNVELNLIKQQTCAACKNSLRRCLRREGRLKDGRTYDLLGYSAEDLRQHIEKGFQSGMSWGNYGTWEIDHRRPIADFPLGSPLHVINALSNLQPLWRSENRKKGKYAGHGFIKGVETCSGKSG